MTNYGQTPPSADDYYNTLMERQADEEAAAQTAEEETTICDRCSKVIAVADAHYENDNYGALCLECAAHLDSLASDADADEANETAYYYQMTGQSWGDEE